MAFFLSYVRYLDYQRVPSMVFHGHIMNAPRGRPMKIRPWLRQLGPLPPAGFWEAEMGGFWICYGYININYGYINIYRFR